jgi:hypothetical protein
MPKGPRKSRNPVERLVAQVSQLNHVVDSILDSADKPGFVEAIVTFKEKKSGGSSRGQNQNKQSREVNKLLKIYPGLAKPILITLKSKISEYKGLGVIDKYKTVAQDKEKPKS